MVSEIFVVVFVYAIFITLFSSGTLLFFGRGNKNYNSKSAVANETPQEQVQSSSETDDSKIIALKERAKVGPPKRMIPKDQLEKGKKELRTLLVEKELVAAALTRLYQAEASGEITKEERETLGARYREDLKRLDKKIRGLDVFIEVGDLETLRDQLLRLVGEKIDAIEKRIERTQIQAQPLIQEILERNSPKAKSPRLPETPSVEKKPQVPDISDMLVPSSVFRGVEEKNTSGSTPVASELAAATSPQTEIMITEPVSSTPAESNDSNTERTPMRKRSPTSSDRQVEELQKELLEALDRLEKLDVEA